jgi:hypothetical protein
MRVPSIAALVFCVCWACDPPMHGPPPPRFGATLSRKSFPTALAPGEVGLAQLSLVNAGAETWRIDETFLSSRDTPPNLWGLADVRLLGDIPPAGVAVFDLELHAASSAPFPDQIDCQLFDGRVGFFGPLVTAPIAIAPLESTRLDGGPALPDGGQPDGG